MTTTTKQDKDFLDVVFPGNLLEDSIAWIRNNMEPDEVFTSDDLEAWAVEHGMNYEK